jgi:WD40 repeat protein
MSPVVFTETPQPTATWTVTPQPSMTPTSTLTPTPTQTPMTPITIESIKNLFVLQELTVGSEVRGLSFHPGGDSLFFHTDSGDNGSLRMVNINNGSDRFDFQDAYPSAHCRNGMVASHSIDISDDGRFVAASAPAGVQVWNLLENKLIYSFPFKSAGLVNFSPDGTLLAAGICGYFDLEPENIAEVIKIWDMRSGEQIQLLEGHLTEAVQVNPISGNKKVLLNFMMQLLFSNDGKQLLSGGVDSENKSGLTIWDVHSGAILQKVSISPYKGAVANSLDFNQDGDILLTLDQAYEPAIRLWKYENGGIPDKTPIKTIKMDRDYGLAKFNHRGDLIFTLSTEPMVLAIWNVEEEKMIYQEEVYPERKVGHYSTIVLDISPDDTILAVGGWPGFIRLYGINQ